MKHLAATSSSSSSAAATAYGWVILWMLILVSPACDSSGEGESRHRGGDAGAGAVASGGSAGVSTTTNEGGTGGAAGGQPVDQEPCNGIDDDQDGKIDEGCSCEPGTTQDCFGGPIDKAELGLCSLGTQLCQSDGSWGECEGQVLPAAEKCDALDHDCDGEPRNGNPETAPCDTGELGICSQGMLECTEQGLVCKQKSQASFEICNGKDDDCNGLVDEGCAKQLTTWGVDWQDWISSMAVRGDMVVVASLNSYSNAGSYVMRLDPNSLASKWYKAKVLDSGGGKVLISDLAVDSQNNIVAVGSVTGGTSEQSPLGGTDVFVAKLDSGGKLLWQQLMGGSSDDGASVVTVLADDSIVFGGSFQGNASLAGVPLASAGGVDGFVAHIDPAGSPKWALGFGSAGLDQVEALAVAAGGEVLVAGEVSGGVDLGGGGLPAVDGAVVAKLTAAGQHVWSRHLAGSIEVEALVVRPNGDWVLGGSANGTFDLGGGPLTDGPGVGSLIAVFGDGASAPSWHWVSKGGYGRVWALTTDAAGDVFFTGYAKDEVDFGVGPIAAIGGPDVVVGRLDPNGTPQWVRRFGNSFSQLYASERGRDIALMPNTTLLVAGQYWESMDLGGFGLKASDPGWKLQCFVARFEP